MSRVSPVSVHVNVLICSCFTLPASSVNTAEVFYIAHGHMLVRLMEPLLMQIPGQKVCMQYDL